MDTLESNPILPAKPEDMLPIESQAAAVAAPVKTRKRTSLTVISTSIRPTKSRRPITQDGEFMCKAPGCNFTTKYEFNLQRHAQRHAGKQKGSNGRYTSAKLIPKSTRSISKPVSEIFKCNQCSYSTAYKCNLKRHFATHPKDPTFGCHYCEFRSRWKSNVTSHEKRKHYSGVPRMISGQNKMGKVRVTNDMKTKKDQRRKCQMDTLTSANNSVLSREGRFHCRDCDFMSNNKSLFVSHIMKRHSDEEQVFPCTFPGCSFRSKWSQWATAHERRAHSSNRSQSKSQKKAVQASEQLKPPNAQFVKDALRQPSKKIRTNSSSPKITPTKEGASRKKVKCPKCEYMFDQRYLQRHLMVHSAEKPFGCSVNGCDYRTRWPADLKKHRISHGKVAKKSTQLLQNSTCQQGKGGNIAIATSGNEKRFTTQDGRNLVKHGTSCQSAGPVPRLSSRPTRQLTSNDKGCRFCDCTNKISSVRKHVKGKKPAAVVVDQTEVDKDLSLADDEGQKENGNKEASMEPIEQAASAEFACTLCDFVGYSEAAAWDHAKCHRQPLRPNDNLKEIPVILLD